jgi:hypothetical protein
MQRWIKYSLEAAAALAGIVMIAAVLLIWRLSSEPLSTERLTPYLERQLAELVPGTTAKIGRTVLAWDNTALDITLNATDIAWLDSNQLPLVQIPDLKLRFRPSRLLLGRLLPQSIAAERPQITLTRLPDGNLVLGNPPDEPQTTRPAAQPEIRQVLIDALEDLASRSAISAVGITQATLLVRDSTTRLEYAYNVPEIRLQDSSEGLEGMARLEIMHQDTPTQAIAHYAYRQSDDTHSLTLRLADFNPSGIARQFGPLDALRQLDMPITGEMTVRVAHDLKLVQLQGQFDAAGGTITNPDFWDEPRSIKGAVLKLDFDAKRQDTASGQLTLDLGGPTIALEAMVKPENSQHDGVTYDYAYEADITMANVPMDDYAKVWPKPVITNARAWIAANMSAGMFRQGAVKLTGRISFADVNATTLDGYSGSIEASNGTVRYIDGMPPVTNVNASGTFDTEKMDIAISGGGIGAIRLQPFTVQLTDFQKHPQIAHIPLRLVGPVPDVLRLLNAPRLRYADKMGIKPDTTGGTVEGTASFSFPMLKDIDLGTMVIKADAVLKNFSAQKVAANFDLSDATLALNLDNDGIRLQGPTSLNKVPLNLDWSYVFAPTANQPLYKAVLQGSVQGHHWKQLGLDLPVIITGPADAKATITQLTQKPVIIKAEANFRQTAMAVPLLNWQKAVGATAQLTVQAEIPTKGPIAVKNLSLRGQDLTIQGTLQISGDGGTVLNADIAPLQAGRTNATIHYERNLAPMARSIIAVSGESLDLSGLLGKNDNERAAASAEETSMARQFVVQLARLYTTPDDFLTNLRGRAVRDATSWQDIDLQALANGTEAVVVRLGQNDDSTRFLNVTSNDVGQMLKSLGLTKSVEGGKLEIRGQSLTDNPAALSGTIAITSFSVGDLPALVRLLNAISPLGFADLLTGRSTFNRLRGKFTLDQDLVSLKNIRIAGPTYGMTLEGKVDIDNEQANLNGTLVPFSFVNGILNNIPLIGDLITGGEGQGVFAVAYSIQGPLGDPRINVNPVSALMPGFVRNLFFAGDED